MAAAGRNLKALMGTGRGSVISPERSQTAATAEQVRQPNARRRISYKRYLGVGVAVGLAFAVLDAVVNANPLAEQAYAVFAPILRPGIDIGPAIAIDLVYGFALSGMFVVLYRALPGRGPLPKGVSFGVLLWFLRVVMSGASQWVLFAIPAMTVGYTLVSGLVEMVLLGVVLGVLMGRLDDAGS